jgi:hypothetical protein
MLKTPRSWRFLRWFLLSGPSDNASGSDAKNDNKFVVFYGLVLSGLSDIACGSEPKNDTQVSFF